MDSGVRLRAAEAVPLAHALVAHVASGLDVRVLAIKGPALAQQGLRQERDSADVDVLVHPADLETLVDGLVAVGWKRGVTGTYVSFMPAHSVNVLNDHWPIGIDVHHYFPGFLADPGEVFDTLWVRREQISLAGVPVPACDPVSQVAIVALHHLRVSPDAESAPLVDLAERARSTFSKEDFADLVRLAQDTDATETLRPFLIKLGVDASELGPATHPEALDAWHSRVRQVGYEAWLEHFAHLPKRQWPGAFWHALMLTPDEIYVYSNRAPGDGNLTMLRLRRIRRGIAGVPRTVKAMARSRRDSPER